MFSRCRFLGRALGLVGVLVAPLAAQLTTPERTNYAQTSSHADVLAFLDSLSHRGARMHVGTLGTSPQGRRIPFVVLARPLVTTPAAAKATGKPIYYIQANIHAGEVEGKEAVQMLMRDLTLGSLKPMLDSMIVLFVPIYNADGNDAWGPAWRNRGEQQGPDIVGLRPNGQGYDLNRDYVKQEAPETRGSLDLIRSWDPDLFMDLHTTDGSMHGYALTWSPGLNANRTPTNSWVQDTVLEMVRRRVREREHFETYPYGNFGGGTPPTRWDTYESTPRYGVNLAGMTRLAILSEAMSHDPFPRRVASTYAFVLESMRYLNEHKAEMRRREGQTAAARPDSIVVRGNQLGASKPRMDTVLVAVTRTVEAAPRDTTIPFVRAPVIQDTIGVCAAPAAAGAGGRGGRGAGGGGRGGAAGAGGGRGRGQVESTGEAERVVMQVFDRFDPVRQEARPAAYVFDGAFTPVVERLRRQGIEVEKTTARWIGPAMHFPVDSIIRPSRRFEGHCSPVLEGHWVSAATDTVPAGSFVVSTNQRFGSLAAFLLEPASEDGYATWNFFDSGLSQGANAPVRRFMALPRLATVKVP
jgi:hypothetical protein